MSAKEERSLIEEALSSFYELRLRCGWDDLDIGLTRPKRSDNGDRADHQIVCCDLAADAGKGDHVVKAGIAEDAGTKHSRVRVCNTLMEAECFLKERARKVFVLYHLQIFIAVLNCKTVVNCEELKGKSNPVSQSFPIIVDDCLLY